MGESIATGEVVSIQRGITYKSQLIGAAGPILLGLGTINRHGGFRADAVRTYGGDSQERHLVQPGQLFASLKDVTQTADVLGAVARLPLNSPIGRLTQDTVRLDFISSRVPVEYLYWMLRTPQYRDYCRNHATGTTTMGLSREAFFAFKFPAPDDARSHLVALLGAIDAKICVNENLALSAVALADGLFSEQVLGVPFSEYTFADIAVVGGGGTPSTKSEEFWGGQINWATPTDVTALRGPHLESTARKITDEGLGACASSLYPEGSILMSSRATVGAFAIAQQPTAVNQGFIVVNAKDPAEQWWLYHEMRSRVPEFLSHANGATFLELSRGRFKALPVRRVDRSVFTTFGKSVRSLHDVAAHALRESRQLAASRDELLPLLVSGTVRVNDVEGDV